MGTLLFTNEGEKNAFDAMMDGSTIACHLFTGWAGTNTSTITLGSFTEASYPDYAAPTVTFSAVVDDGSGNQTITADPVTIAGPTSGDPVAVLGYWLSIDYGSGALLWCYKAFDSGSITLSTSDDTVTITPVIKLHDPNLPDA